MPLQAGSRSKRAAAPPGKGRGKPAPNRGTFKTNSTQINRKGRPKGSVNKLTADTRAVFAMVTNNLADSVEGWINRLSQKQPGRALDLYMKLAEFTVGKVSRLEVSTDPDNTPPMLLLPADPDQAVAAYTAFMRGQMSQSQGAALTHQTAQRPVLEHPPQETDQHVSDTGASTV